MSWDDLRERAARGDLRPDNQIRQGADGNWTPAGEIAGLFAPRAAERAEDDAWYCEILGAELGPMSSSELRLLAERGNLKGDNRVRRGASGEWVLASSRAELAPLVGADVKETDFALAAGQTVQRPKAETEPDDGEPSVESIPATPSASEADQCCPPSSKPASAAASPKSAGERAPRKPPRQPISFDIPYRLLGGIAAVAALSAMFVGGYFAYLRTTTPAPDYRQV
ncbi:MAG TPA: GYF domain-containing protein, partial [Pirellulales bacterium]|nr:GYF domain-containing protein [Pirellulales bacterium]